MSNASLKEQLQAMASQLGDETTSSRQQKMPTKSGAKNKNRRPITQRNDKTGQDKPKWLEYAQYGVELLKAYFPLAFKEIQEVSPLKKGIKQDLVKRLGSIDTIVIEDKACMIKSLAYYVNTNAYHKAMQEGTPRLDLDGQSVEIVTAQEMQYAKERLENKNKTRPVQNKIDLPMLPEDTEKR